MANLKEKFVFICLLLIHLSINQSVCEATTSLLEKKIDVDHDRQGLIGSSLLGGPLALAAFLFSIPTLIPALLMAPLAIAGIGPAIGAVGNFMSNIGGIGLLSPFFSDSSSASSESTSSSGSQPGFGASVSNTLRGLTELLFNRRYTKNILPPQPQQTESDNSNIKPDKTVNTVNSGTNSVTNGRFATLVTSLKDIYGILKNGLRRYEITNSDCQSRIICEVHQKSIARSYGSIISKIFDLFGIDDHLEKHNRNDLIKHFVKAARIGLSNNQCENVYHRCVPHHTSDNVHNGHNGHNGQFGQTGHIDHHSQHYFKQRPAIKSSLMTTPRTVQYYSNINKL